MSGPRRSIFRPAALERHARSQEREHLPPLVRPGAFALLWLLLGLLLIAGAGVAWSVGRPLRVLGPSAEQRR